MNNLDALQSTIGIRFRNQSFLKQAFIHPSYINENPASDLSDNERMEFLGDALLNMVITEKLYLEFPEMPEGKLTDLRVSLIRQEKLTEQAISYDLGKYLFMSNGENQSGGRTKKNNLANTFEALIAAIYLDQGINTVKKFILNSYQHDIEEIKNGNYMLNYKAMLQELTQQKFKLLPQYRITEASGPDHDKLFNIAVYLGENILASGSGRNKKSAEAEGAHIAYEWLLAHDNWNP